MSDATRSDAGQVTRSAADVYEEFFLPALFAPWALFGDAVADLLRAPYSLGERDALAAVLTGRGSRGRR